MTVTGCGVNVEDLKPMCFAVSKANALFTDLLPLHRGSGGLHAKMGTVSKLAILLLMESQMDIFKGRTSKGVPLRFSGGTSYMSRMLVGLT